MLGAGAEGGGEGGAREVRTHDGSSRVPVVPASRLRGCYKLLGNFAKSINLD